MKAILKIVLALLAVAVFAAGAFAAFIHFRGIPTFEAKKPDYHVQVTPEKVARGKKIVLTLCANCHLNKNTGVLTGTQMREAPEFGKLYSQNITADKTYGIGEWTDGELLFLLRTGIKRNGQYTPPYMAKLPHMSDDDIESVIAFLRSDDAMVAAAAVPDTACEPSFLTKFLCLVAFKPLPFPEKPVPNPDTTNIVEYGKYLTFNNDCWTCHSATFEKLNVLDPPLSFGYMGGGNPLKNPEGQTIISSNLTPDTETGIGNWTEEQFVKALRYGLRDGEPALRYPMVPFNHLTDSEAKAIYAYLKTVPAIKNKVERPTL